ncbi:MAG TPA: tetratricopeptide repeat protein [Bryobacteraceae bacterium]|nr:tetratricopeptide repeat protein [Bryobacteraceae bacterium]
MRFTRFATHAAVVSATLLAPIAVSAAPSKEMQDLQRDVAMLSDQVTQMQKAQAASIASLQSTVQQIADSETQTKGTVSNLNSTLARTLQNELKSMHDQLSAVSGLSLKVNNIAEEVGNLGGTVRGIQDSLNKQSQMISDLSNQIKLMQAPAPAPPPLDGAAPGPEASAAPAQPSPETLFSNAKHDQDANRFDLAIDGYQRFLKAYPNDPNAIAAQYNIGNAYYSQADTVNAVKAYDAAIERYPADKTTTPNAYYMKGMALKKQGKKQEARLSFEAAIKAAPDSDAASQSTQQLHSMGYTTKKTTKRSTR